MFTIAVLPLSILSLGCPGNFSRFTFTTGDYYIHQGARDENRRVLSPLATGRNPKYNNYSVARNQIQASDGQKHQSPNQSIRNVGWEISKERCVPRGRHRILGSKGMISVSVDINLTTIYPPSHSILQHLSFINIYREQLDSKLFSLRSHLTNQRRDLQP